MTEQFIRCRFDTLEVKQFRNMLGIPHETLIRAMQAHNNTEPDGMTTQIIDGYVLELITSPYRDTNINIPDVIRVTRAT